MKILLCHNYYRNRGGEDIFVDNLGKLLQKNGHEVIWFTADSKEIETKKSFGKIKAGIDAIHSKPSVNRLNEIIEQNKPDLAHIHNVFPILSPSIYRELKKHNIPVIQHVHNFRFLCPNGLFYTQGEVCFRCRDGNFLNAIRYKCLNNNLIQSVTYAASLYVNSKSNKLKPNINSLICLNEFTADIFRKQFADKIPINVLGNYCEPRGIPKLSEPRKKIVYMGRLSKEKGVLTVFDAAKMLPNYQFDFVGNGPLENYLKSEIMKLSLSNVNLHGHVSGNKRFSFFDETMCLVIPSVLHEQFGIVTIEAFSSHVPVIGSNMGGIPSIIEHGKNGYLFEAGNVDELASLIKSMGESPLKTKIMGKAAFDTYQTKYRPEIYYQSLLEIYSNVIATQKMT